MDQVLVNGMSADKSMMVSMNMLGQNTCLLYVPVTLWTVSKIINCVIEQMWC